MSQKEIDVLILGLADTGKSQLLQFLTLNQAENLEKKNMATETDNLLKEIAEIDEIFV